MIQTLIAISALGLTQQTMTEQVNFSKVGIDQNQIKKLDERLKAASPERIAGTVTLVVKDGKPVHFKAHGYADIENKIPMKTDTLFQVMSMTKPVTALAVVLCAEDGLLNLDDRVEKYFPALSMAKVDQQGTLVPQSRKPTIRNLLCHTSGLSSSDPGGMSDEEKARMTLSQYGTRIGSSPLSYQPDSKIEYSGVGYSTLAGIVEKVTGSTFDDFVQKRILDPIGMKDTYFFLPENRRKDLAKTYYRESGRLLLLGGDPYRTGAKFVNGAGGLYSNAQDMAKFIQIFLNNGRSGSRRVVSPASIEVMTSLQTRDLMMDGTSDRGFGLGWSLMKTPASQVTLRSLKSFGHTGAFCTEYWADPNAKLVAVFMSQGFGVGDDVRKMFNTMVNASMTKR